MGNGIAQRRVAYLFLGGLVLLADQGSKWFVQRMLVRGEVREIIPGFFRLTHTRNPGAAFGIFSDFDSPWV